MNARAAHRRSPLASRIALLLVLAAGTSANLASCKAKRDDGTTPAGVTLPPLELRDDSKDLLLTWIDERGDFHVVQGIPEVPAHARDAVRVVVTSKDDGSVTDQVYVANLLQKKPDGTYDVQSLSRGSWDALAAKHRKPAPGSPPAGSGPGIAEGPSPGEVKPGGVVVIYGAAWCGPCHQAQRYLEAKKVNVIYKDIEADPRADAEMQKKLEAAGKRGGTIPVIDVGGRILVGFRPGALDDAVAAMTAKGTEL